MAKKIALFNHKGGVSKTTTTFNLGWMLASKGMRVILVDTDPQCNLTGLVLGYKGAKELERFYQDEPQRNLKSGLAPAFESRPEPIKAVECVPVSQQQEGLFLLPGHIGLAEYEVTLGIAQELSGSIQTLQNLPGSISYLLRKTAAKYRADYILIDMSPSLSAFNQNLLMTSHFFILPTTPDFFSVMAINSLVNVLPRWQAWSKKAQSLPILRDATYPFPAITPKFLGTVIQNYRPWGGDVPAKGFLTWIDAINSSVSQTLVPTLEKLGMTLPIHVYKEQGAEDFCLATISSFNSLIAKSQSAQTPIYELTAEQISQSGVVLERTMQARDRFKEIFSKLADKVIGLTSDASGN